MTQTVVQIENDLKYAESTDIPIPGLQIEGQIPESTIYVDTEISNYLNAEIFDSNIEFAYAIDGRLSKDTTVDEDYVQFEVYAANLCSNDFSSDDESDVDSIDELSDEDDTELEYLIENVPLGIIVNSIIYLPENNWHTIIDCDDTLAKCGVCELFTSADSCHKHTESFNHNLYLNRYKPLKKYDLNIIRKINYMYHCGQCNEMFPIKEIDNHFSSETHKKSVLLSINKASNLNHNETNNNVTDDVHNNDSDDNDTYKGISYASIAMKPKDDLHNNDSDDNDTCKGISYASIAKKPKAMEMPKFLIIDLGSKKIKIIFDSWNMITVTKANTLHCMACNKSEHIRFKAQHCTNVVHIENLMKCTVVEEFKDHLVRQVNNCPSLYHCAHCNNIQYKIEMGLHINIMHPLKNKANDRKLSVNSSTSSENLSPVDSGTRNENAHSNDKNTLSNVKNAVGNEKNTSGNDKNAIDNVKNAVGNDKNTSGNDKNANSNENAIGNDKNTVDNDKNAISNDKNVIGNDKNVIGNDKNAIGNEPPKMVIYPFGYKVIIPVLSYNAIIERQYFYNCELCVKSMTNKEISLHINDLKHIQLLQMTPFISFYGMNLIRSMREHLHCAICNVNVSPVNIFGHNSNLYHRHLLAKTLNIPLDKLPSFSAPPQLAATNGGQFQTQFLPNAPQTVPYAPQTVPYAPQMLPYRPQIIGIPNSVRNMQYIQSNNGYQQAGPFSPPIGAQSPFSRPQSAQSPFSRPQSAQMSEINATGNVTNCKIDNNDIKANSASEQETEALHVSECQTVDIVPPDCEDNLDESTESVDVYDTEEYIYLKLRNMYFRITFSSYNTLVHVGDGSRYCFICASNVGSELRKHVDSRSHLENIDKYHFVDKYEKHLLRQMFLQYHCSICNLILTQKELKKHIEWSTHTQEMEIAQSIAKKSRRKEIDSGIKQFIIKTTKDQIFLNIKPVNIKILMNIKISNVKDTECQTLGKNKIISFKNKVLKFNFTNWHSIRTKKDNEDVSKCIICLMKIDRKEVMAHVELESHKNNLNKSFKVKYFPALIRPVNDEISNCIYCNVQLLNTHVSVHIRGGRHKKNVEAIHKESASTSTYEDCEGDMMTV